MHGSGTAVTMHQKESHPSDGLDVQGSHGTMKKFKDILSDRVYIRQPEVGSGSGMSLGQAANRDHESGKTSVESSRSRSESGGSRCAV